jgi:predicted HTH transcriptional regulator
MPSEEELRTLLARTAEAAELDFKSKFEIADAGDWLEIIKDIAAFANSGGGTILIGVNDDGTPSGADVAGALAIDPADLTNRIHNTPAPISMALSSSSARREGIRSAQS